LPRYFMASALQRNRILPFRDGLGGDEPALWGTNRPPSGTNRRDVAKSIALWLLAVLRFWKGRLVLRPLLDRYFQIKAPISHQIS
jgi:hypothetical protein